MQALRAVRDADVRGVWSPNAKHADSAAALARSLDIGDAQPFASISDMVADPAIDALWLTGPNHTRVETSRKSCTALERAPARCVALRARSRWRALWPKPRTSPSDQSTGIAHGYLENQVFAPQVQTGRTLLWTRGAAMTGRPYLARAAEEHGGPHMPMVLARRAARWRRCSTI